MATPNNKKANPTHSSLLFATIETHRKTPHTPFYYNVCVRSLIYSVIIQLVLRLPHLPLHLLFQVVESYTILSVSVTGQQLGYYLK